MGLTVVDESGVKIVEGAPDELLMRRLDDAVLVVEACLSADTDAALLYPRNLTGAFFDLSSGEAGAILQKLRNYRVRLAVVCAPGAARFSTRFPEVVAEERRGRFFGVFDTRAQAVHWLARPHSVIDLLRPSGALCTIVVTPRTQGNSLVVADIADDLPPDSAAPTPVDMRSLRLLDAEDVDVQVFRSRPRTFARRASSSVYDVHIEHTAIPRRPGFYYLGFPPEWCVCSAKIEQAAASGTHRAWSGLHSHADDSSWIECALGGHSESGAALAVWASVESDPAHDVSRLPEFGVLHHRHSPIEILRDAMAVKPGAFAVKIDLRAIARSFGGGRA